MIGSWRWNAAFGGFGAALTFLFSLGHNPLLTTCLRSIYAFLLFALLAYAVRFVLGLFLLPPSRPDGEAPPEEDGLGSSFDMVTPDEEQALTDMLKENWSDGKDGPVAGFQPLQPPKLVSLDQTDPQDVVQAIRRLNDE